MKPFSDIAVLLDIMERLRDPETGCPWDSRQTFASVAPYTLEEACEVVDAIEQEDMDALPGELGDLLFQVVFHARMAQEDGLFDFTDVVSAICEKMLRRHPHVFAGEHCADEGELRAAWEEHKVAERTQGGNGARSGGVLDGIARSLPALVRAEKLQKRAARVGFDWDRIDGVVAKVKEELEECRQALRSSESQDAVAEEIGDLLFSCVNLARHAGVDAEQALRGANRKFARRFQHVEDGLRRMGLTPGPSVREAMEAFWEESKRSPG